MTETKPEAMTAERMEAVRRRAEYLGRLNRAGYFARGSNALELAACLEDEVPVLLSALEEARDQAEAELDARKMAETNLEASERNAEANLMLAQQFEHERDALINVTKERDALARLAGSVIALRYVDFAGGETVVDEPGVTDHAVWASMRQTIQERDEAQARLADALDSLATMVGHRDVLAEERDALRLERANLAARVAELEGALEASAKSLESIARGWYGMDIHDAQAYAGNRARVARELLTPPKRAALPGRWITCPACAETYEVPTDQPEKAPPAADALPWPVTANAMHACSLSFPDVESATIDNVCGCFTVAECLADTLETVTCLACLREIARQRAPKSTPLQTFDAIGEEAQSYERLRQKLDSAVAPEKAPAPEPAFDMLAHLTHQREWSERTFGPGHRPAGLIDHIRKELKEIERAPNDLTEWIDVVILGLDGAWRSGHSPAEIIAALVAKQAKNESRQWPDWRTAAPGQAIEHIRETEAPAGVTIHGGPEAALWLATPAAELLDRREQAVTNVDARHGYTLEFAPDRAVHAQEYDDEEQRLTRMPAADPLCARDLGGGQKCGHPFSEHRKVPLFDMPIGCYHPDPTDRAVSGRCPCPGFVPEPSGVVDHGTARTCGTCGWWIAGEPGHCGGAIEGGKDPAAWATDSCRLGWIPKAGGSTSQGGGR